MRVLENTGERRIPGKANRQMYLEHMARYIFAGKFAEGKLVLDLACGTGYGSYYLALHGAKKTIGVDISEEAVGYAKDLYEVADLHFEVMDVRKLAFKDKSFDVIVAFEIIEHIREQEEFLKEIRRVLKDDGVLLISTPNSKVYSGKNRFHLKEMGYEEFLSALERFFPEVTVFSQLFSMNSVVFRRDGENPLYMLAVCRKEKVGDELPDLALSFGDIKDAYRETVKENSGDGEKSDKIFSVVIPVYNNKEVLLKALKAWSLQAIPKDKFEVIISDDGSTDGLKEALSELSFPFMWKYLRQEHKGQSAATNLGIKHAEGEYVLLTCSDIIPSENLLEEHLKTHRKFGDVAVLGYIPYSPEIEVTPFMEYLVKGGPLFAYHLIRRDKENVPPDFLYAPNVSVRRKHLLDCGMFDETFTYGCQDTELGIRLRLKGVRLVFNENAVGYHYHPNNVRDFIYRQKMAGKGSVLLARKHPRFLSLHRLKERVLKDYFGKKEIVESLLKAIDSLEKPNSKALSDKLELNFGNGFKRTTPLLWFVYELITSYYFAEGICEEISKVEGDSWLYNFKYPWILEEQLKRNKKVWDELMKEFRRIGIELPALSSEVKPIKKLVSIIILTRNGLEYTKKCIESIFQMTKFPFEIIIVDNGSTDGTCEYLQNLGRKIVLIRNSSNLGFPKACNQGIRKARGDYICLLNNDVVVTEGWLEGLLECLESHTSIGMVGPMSNWVSGPQLVINPGYSDMDEMHAFAREFRKAFRGRWFQLPRLVGFCLLMRRELIEKIGLLDERFGLGSFEDDDLSLRARLAGYKLYCAGDVFVHHFGNKTYQGEKIDYNSLMEENRRKFLEKWGFKSLGEFLYPEMNAFDFERKVLEAEKSKDDGNLKIAEALYREALSIVPHHLDATIELASILKEQGKTEEARELLERILRVFPNSPKIKSVLGELLFELSEIEAAYEHLKEAASIAPEKGDLLNDLAVILHEKGEKGKAFELFLKAVKLDPQNGSALANLVEVGYELERFEEVEGALKIVHSKVGDNPDLLYLLDDCRSRMKALGGRDVLHRKSPVDP